MQAGTSAQQKRRRGTGARRWLACWLMAGVATAAAWAQQNSTTPMATSAGAGSSPGPTSSNGAPQTQTATPVLQTPKPQSTVPTIDNSKRVNPQASEPKIEGDSVRAQSVMGPATTNLWKWQGLTVERIEFEGVEFSAQDKLPSMLAQQPGKPLDADAVRESMRRLYATGRYRNLEVNGTRTTGGVVLTFTGASRYYIGRVLVTGIKQDRLTSLVESSTNLQPGARFAEPDLETALNNVKDAMGQNGYYDAHVTAHTQADDPNQQMNITIAVQEGVKARVGTVSSTGDTGMTQAEFQKHAKLKTKSKVNRETGANALSHLRKEYQKTNRLEAKITLDKKSYVPATHRLDYNFTANRGPIVTVETEGLKVGKSRLHLLVPVYQESAVDNDLLNEGSHNIREYLIRQGYFDAQVSVKQAQPDAQRENIIYTIDKGQKYKVVSVNISGVKYFPEDLLRERMQVQKADHYIRNGRYSPQLLEADEDAIEAMYRANGFSDVKVTTDVKSSQGNAQGKASKVGSLRVTYNIAEGSQQKFGEVKLTGVDMSRDRAVRALMNSTEGQPFSLVTLSGDRDTILSYYLANGFDQARISVEQQRDPAKPDQMDVLLNIVEGPQVFIDKVLLSGIHYTKPRIVQRELRMHPGDPLDQSQLLDTQRRLYNLALFNEVNTAVQNPNGDATSKNVLVQLTEAKRWDITYGFGFEAQTGLPTTNCLAQQSLNPHNACSPEGKLGVSPRVSVDVTRINVLGRDNTLTLHTTYGLLEQIASLTFDNPQVRGNPKFGLSLSGGYSNVQNITTYQAATLQQTVKLTQRLRKQDTLIYDYTFRNVAINQSSLQVAANLIPLLAQPDRTGGPEITWLHDTRQPTPLDASHGSYTSVQEFIAHSIFGAETDFNRVDMTNSTYYALDKKKRFILARNTRFGFENSFGKYSQASTNPNCLGGANGPINYPSCTPIPLPERLYAGGATSHRGFPINAAGPRDLLTGYPVGGTAVFVNTVELRFPAPILPVIGDNLGLVLFHDMGNVFTNISDVGPAFGRFHQPDSATCSQYSSNANFAGVCDFAYFSHAVGLGLRYKTPVGPLRVDFSYNLNPPYYPIIQDFSDSLPVPRLGQAGHFNFFFSIGQSF